MTEERSWDPFWTGDREPEPEPVGPPVGTTKEVLGWVGSDKDRAQEALDNEESGLGRKGLISALKDLLS